MSNLDAANMGAAIAAQRHRPARPFLGRTRRVAAFVPRFAYLLIIFMIIEYSVADVNAVLFSFGYNKISAVLFIMGLALPMLIIDLTWIARPNVNKVKDQYGIIGVAILYLFLYALATILLANGLPLHAMRIFGTTEFLLLMIASVGEAIGAMAIVGFTLPRIVDMANSNLANNDHHLNN